MSIVKFSDLIKPPRHISIQAFMLRLFPQERVLIRTTAQSVPEVQDWLFVLESGKYVDLDRNILIKKLEYQKMMLPTYLTSFLSSNKRIDRDCVIRTKTKIELLEELLKLTIDK